MPDERREQERSMGLVEHCPEETCVANHHCVGADYPGPSVCCPIYEENAFTVAWKERVDSIAKELTEAITAREEGSHAN